MLSRASSRLARQSAWMSTTSSSSEVLFSVSNGVGTITLNRPKAMNALNLPMIRAIYPTLKEWETSPAVNTVVIQGAGDKAFCAGGDVRALYDEKVLNLPTTLRKDFFKEEYMLNHLISRYSKPYVALIDGVTMGGGVGLSVHGSIRVATENTLFAMPETALGLFPDVGGSFVLPRLQGQLGMYLALTGDRLKGADLFHAGIATHFIESSKLSEFTRKLDAGANPVDLASAMHAPLPFNADGVFGTLKNVIDSCFSHESVASIIAALEADGSDFATGLVKKLNRASPTSLLITHRQLTLGASLSIESCLAMEYAMSQKCVSSHDFFEGVRSILVDKDRNPKWNPASIADVNQETVVAHFQEPSEPLHL